MPLPLRIQALFSTTHFLNTGFFAFILVFSPLYAEQIGFSAVQIGILNTSIMLASMLSSPLVLQLAGPNLTPGRLLQASALLAPVFFVLLLLTDDFFIFLLLWTAFIALRVAGGTLIDVQLVKHSAHGALRFEFIRTWGSVGFIALGFLLGFLFDLYHPIRVVQYLTAYVILQSILCFVISKFLEPYEQSDTVFTFRKVLGLLRQSRIAGLFLSVSLIWLSHAPFYVYLSLYLQSIGWSSSEISLAWNIGVIAEILLFLFFRRISVKFSLRKVLLVSMLITVIRWVVMGYFQNFYVLLFSQILHAFSFGACYLVSIRLTYEWFPEGYKEKSQGLLTFFGQGLGSFAGRWLVSVLSAYYVSYSDFYGMFYVSALVAMVAVMVCFVYCKDDRNQDEIT
jgi:MFS transporter, PPP family, 3-phenylpropionic acid transporter